MRRAAGFTLIELMIVVVIIAILAALAMNSYRQYILRGNRTSATSALQSLTSREENYYFTNNTYAQTLNSLGAAASMAGPYYTVVVPAANSSTYTVEADAIGTQMQDTACLKFQLTRAGVQSVFAGSGTVATCWQGQ